MTPSERIKIKQAITAKLAHSGWTEIELVLNEFGLPTWADFKPDVPDSYIIQSLATADNGTLHGIAEHLAIGIDPASGPAEPLPSFWESGYFKLFISHRSEDAKIALKMQDFLLRFQISCFVAHEAVEPTKQWQSEIESGLRTMDALVSINKPGFSGSVWTNQEVGWALGRGKLVVSLRAGEDPRGFAGKEQALPVKKGDKPSAVANRVFDVLRKHELTRRAILDPLLTDFEISNSFEAAKARLGHIEDSPEFSTEDLARLHKAFCTNPQISESFGVHSRLTKLLEQHGFTTPLPPKNKDEF